MGDSVADDYRSSLADLNFNSKPHINVLTMIAEENVKHAPKIVETIVAHINSVPPTAKLPSLYLIDSIMKNIGGQYITLFIKHVVTLFTSVFSKVDEATRSSLYKLRQTWNEILPKNVLYELDCKVNAIDPAWPITAKPDPPVMKKIPPPAKNTIHVNPKFLPNTAQTPPKSPISPTPSPSGDKSEACLNEMLRQIEEKKLQLKVLEQKKLEMAAKQKKNAQNNQRKPIVNHRDPRLKKIVPESQDNLSKFSPLQSVVVMPSTKDPSILQNVPVVKTEVKIDPTIIKIEPPSSPTFKSTKGERNKNCKTPTKKRSLSPDAKPSFNESLEKKICTEPLSKSKRLIAERECLQPTTKEGRPVPKKGKHDFAKLKDKHSNENRVSPANDQNQSEKGSSTLFGNEDKDYRHQSRNTNAPKSRQWHPRGRGGRPLMPPRMSHTSFYPRAPGNMIYDSREQNKLHVLKNRPDHSPILRPPLDDGYSSPQSMDVDQNVVKSEHITSLNNDVNRHFKPIAAPNEIQNQNYNSSPIPLPPPLPPAQEIAQPKMHTTFKLDGKDRIVYFINKRALTLMDNNEPRELTFIGKPTNVYIEGLPQPLLLSFDGRPIEFETEGKRNTIHFGTPLREVYINNFPYKADFGGDAFTALLEDKKEHKILIDGPPPQVIVSEKPAFELFDIYNQSRRLSPPVPKPLNSSVNNQGPNGSAILHDVDMRVKSSHPVNSSSVLPDGGKDVDWRHNATGGEASQIPWNGPKDSFETYKPNLPGQNSFAGTIPNTVMPCPSQWDDTSKGIGMPRNNPPPDARFAHPDFKQTMPHPERPRFESSHPMRPRFEPPHPRPPGPSVTAWERQPTPLPPPPAVPASFNLPPMSNRAPVPNTPVPSIPPSNVSNMPTAPQSVPLGVCGSSWNPLPPPPMFTGSVPDMTPVVVSASSIAPISSTISTSVCAPEPSAQIVPSLPINVETIFEKLVAAGIISKPSKEPVPQRELAMEQSSPIYDNESSDEEAEPEIVLVPKNLREYRPSVIAALYRGSQCATCGMRFKEIQSEQYSRHLDWHFRMNRREKDGAKKAYSRRLFYEIKDWIQFKEVEEAEERTPSYFELQADGESKNEEDEKIQSVPASECESEKCAVCSEVFQLFWVEEEEEWHLKHAVRHDGEVYHPLCYEDFKKAQEQARIAAEAAAKAAEEAAKAAEEAAKLAAEEAVKAAAEEAARIAEEAAMVKVEIKEESTEEMDTTSANEEEKPPADDVKNAAEESETSQLTGVKEEETTIAKEEEEPSEEEKMEETAKPTPVKEEPVEQLLGMNSDADSDGEEFRPPTPDPRFNVQPPVIKSKEMSALCSIM